MDQETLSYLLASSTVQVSPNKAYSNAEVVSKTNKLIAKLDSHIASDCSHCKQLAQEALQDEK